MDFTISPDKIFKNRDWSRERQNLESIMHLNYVTFHLYIVNDIAQRVTMDTLICKTHKLW